MAKQTLVFESAKELSLNNGMMVITDKITGELDNVQEEMNNHFTNQKSENVRLQKEIAGLKEEKKQLQDLLMGLQRRITDLEAQAGIISSIPNHTV